MPKALNILISPLDWGLGHASRIVPLLRKLEGEGHHLMIGVNELTSPFIKEHIPNANFYQLPSYGIKYSQWGSFLSFAALAPKILKAKRAEESWVLNFVKENPVDFIISDSRFGFKHPDVKSIIISHQLNLQFPRFWKWPGRLAQKINEKWLLAFNEIWVPDEEDHYLSGDLSKNPNLEAQFMGIQSRLEKEEGLSPEESPFILCILSGPEPQRSVLEQMIRHQSPQIKQHVVIVGGKPHQPRRPYNCANTTYFNHMDDQMLANYIEHADLVISRSGYSSLMDYYHLACKRLFLIPTPGQTEQIYLAKRMEEMGICDYTFQKNFIMKDSIDKSSGFIGMTPKRSHSEMFKMDINSKILQLLD